MSISGTELKKAIKIAGFTTAEIAEKIGVSREHLTRMMGSDSVSDVYLAKIRNAGIVIENVIKSDPTPKMIPYYDIDAQAGNVTIFNEDRPEYVKQHISVPAFQDCDMFINVSGNSMYPKFCSGELVALKKINDLDVVPLNEAYLIVTKEQRLLKYIRKGPDKEHWLLFSENPEFEAFEIAKKKILHLYIVKGKIAKNII